MSQSIRPMLAAKTWDKPELEAKHNAIVQKHLDECGYLIAQPKVDGMRYLHDKQAMSRAWKLLPNKYLQAFVKEHPELLGIDGEVIPGHIYSPEIFREAMSGIRSEQGSPEFTIYAFDLFDPENASVAFIARHSRLFARIGEAKSFTSPSGYDARIVFCPSEQVNSLEQIASYEERMLLNGWEGIILRRPDRPYKWNRSTLLDGSLMKVKRFQSDDAIVIGYEPWYINTNEATISELGFTTRSSHQDNLVPIERLGALLCRLVARPEVEFKVGVFLGVDHDERNRLWLARESLLGRHFEFKHQGYGGGYDKPRTPVFLRWRSASEF